MKERAKESSSLDAGWESAPETLVYWTLPPLHNLLLTLVMIECMAHQSNVQHVVGQANLSHVRGRRQAAVVYPPTQPLTSVCARVNLASHGYSHAPSEGSWTGSKGSFYVLAFTIPSGGSPSKTPGFKSGDGSVPSSERASQMPDVCTSSPTSHVTATLASALSLPLPPSTSLIS